MVTPVLHVIGIDPGGTTGWCRLAIPTMSIFGDEPGAILEKEFGEFTGDENDQADSIARLARERQGLAYRVGPALVVEKWDFDPSFQNSDEEPYSPLRIAAKLGYIQHIGKLGDATLSWQGRTQAKSTATDERLRAWKLWSGTSDHTRDATRHAITVIRRAARDADLAAQLWPYVAEYYGLAA